MILNFFGYFDNYCLGLDGFSYEPVYVYQKPERRMECFLFLYAVPVLVLCTL